MGKIEGNYVLEKSEKFLELMVKLGIPEEQAKIADDAKATLTVKVNGKNISWKYEGLKTFECTLIDGEEVEEPMPFGKAALSTTKVEGDILKISSKQKNGGGKLERTYTFTDQGLKTEMTSDSGITATRYFKRV